MGSYTQGNDTYACSSSGCQISCASPEFGANVCYSMQQNFLDGTSCQGGGKCSNGQCEGASVSKEITSWISSNKTLVISLSCVIGGLLILTILSCCISRYRKRKRAMARLNAPPPGWSSAPPGWPVPPPVAQGRQRTRNRSQPNMSQSPSGGGYWEDGRWKPTTVPPPVWTPGPSVRYA